MRNASYQETDPNPYDLPAGKEYHIFIACSGLDSRKGKWLLEQLERRYPFRCVYHERDFQAGEMIVDNIRVFIEKSVKVLLLISNGFLQSYHCKLEETFAMSLSNETGRNCIIPVLLEDVELPPVLRHMTYIDARLQGDVIAQIREAFCRTANQIGLTPNLCNIGADDNGKRLGVIEGDKTSSCPFTCRYQFTDFDIRCIDTDAETRRHMEEMCLDIITTLNASKGLRWYGFFTPFRQVIWMLVSFAIFTIIVCCSFIGKAVSDDTFDYGSAVYTPLIVGASTFPTVFFFITYCIGSRFSAKHIEKVVWDIAKQHYKQSKCLVFYNNVPVGSCFNVCCFRGKPELVVIQYDLKPCKEYVLLYLRNKFSQFAHNYDAFEEWADKLLENTIAYYAHDLIHWDDIPRSYYNRHDTWKQRECIWQLLEPHLSGLQLGQHIWFSSLSKREHKTFSSGYVDYGRTVIL